MKDRARDLLLVLATLIVLVPVSELVVRLVAPQTLPSQEQIREYVVKDMYVLDEAAGYRLAPDFEGRLERAGHVTEFRTNAQGLRSDPMSAKTKPRILALGDSFTWGWGVGQDEPWIARVAAELADDGIETEPLNGGVNGYGTESALALLRRLGPELQPDVVLLGFFANDYTDNLIGARNTYTVRDGYLFDQFSHEYFQESPLARHSHLYRMLTSAWATANVRFLGGVPGQRLARNFTPAEFEEGRELSHRWIRELDAECRNLGVRFAVIWLPADVYAGRSRPEDIPLRASLQRQVAEDGIPSLDLLPVVNREQRVQGLYLPGDGHFSPRGHRVAGRAIARFLEAEGMVAR